MDTQKIDEAVHKDLSKHIRTIAPGMMQIFASSIRRLITMTELMRREANFFDRQFTSTTVNRSLRQHIKHLDWYLKDFLTGGDSGAANDIKRRLTEDKLNDLNVGFDFLMRVDNIGVVVDWLTLQDSKIEKETTKLVLSDGRGMVMVSVPQGKLTDEQIKAFKFTISKQLHISVEDIEVA